MKYLEELSLTPESRKNLVNLSILFEKKEKDPIESFTNLFNYRMKIQNRFEDEPDKVEEKIENIETLKRLFEEYPSTEEGITEFLDSLIEMEKKEKQKDKVILSTVHSAKGLEWKHVFLAGCNEKILPFYFDDLSKLERDDELRLFYVAISRAKDSLIISHSVKHDFRFLEPSSFIDIIFK